MTFDIWHLTFDISWHLTFHDIWHFMTFDISQDLLRSHKIYWDLTRSTEISKDLLIWHYVFDICHLVFDIWHWNHMTWYSKMILAQTYLIFTDGFWGYISNLKTFTQSVGRSVNNIGLRDASASKNPKMLVFTRVYVCVKTKLTLVSFFCDFFLCTFPLNKYGLAIVAVSYTHLTLPTNREV